MFEVYTLAVLAISEGGSLVDVNPGLIIWTVVTFVILLFVLKKIAWKPILTALAQREDSIKESLEKAEKAKEEAQKVLKQNEAVIAKAEEESKKIIEQSRQFAEKLKEQIVKESKEQARKIIEDASGEIERKKDAAFDELKDQVAGIAVQAAAKILNEKLDEAMHKKIVNKYINEMRKN
jgi:F-type H+-transporting ATPase subunit b